MFYTENNQPVELLKWFFVKHGKLPRVYPTFAQQWLGLAPATPSYIDTLKSIYVSKQELNLDQQNLVVFQKNHCYMILRFCWLRFICHLLTSIFFNVFLNCLDFPLWSFIKNFHYFLFNIPPPKKVGFLAELLLQVNTFSTRSMLFFSIFTRRVPFHEILYIKRSPAQTPEELFSPLRAQLSPIRDPSPADV